MVLSTWRHRANFVSLAGACLIFIGCGGSDIPDPGADSAPVVESSVPPQPVAPVQEPAAEPKAEAPAVAAAPAPSPAPAATPAPAPATSPAPAAVDPAPAAVPPQQADASTPAASGNNTVAETAPSAQPKSDGGAAAAEMLALSEATLPPPDPATATPPGSPGAQFQGVEPGAAGFGGGAQAGFGAAPFDRTKGAGIRRRGDEEFGELGGMKYRERGGAPRNTKPVNYHDPHASVKAFLEALKDKDVDRLSEATALRSPYESSAKHRELFQRIVDGSISEAQLNDLADNLDDYTISGDAAVTSTGRRGVLVTKKTKTGKMQRKITVRKEKAGWKVLDISSIIEFKNFQRYTRQRSSQSSN